MRLSAWITIQKLTAFLMMLFLAANLCVAQDEEAKEEKKDENGIAELDEAFSLKLTAQTTRDLDKVVDLLEDAIDKGLDEEGVENANQLMSSTLYEHAELLSKKIFDSGGRDQRWRRFRSQALTRLERAIELNPKMGQAFQLIARLNGLPAGDREEGREAIEKAVELAGDDTKQLSKSLVIRASLADDDDQMLGDLSQAIKIDPDNVDAIRVRGTYYLRKNEPEKAVEDFKAWLAADRENLAAYHQVARSLAGQQKFDEAIEIMDSAVKVKEDSKENYLIRAQLNMLRKSYDEVIKDSSEALKLDRKLFLARLLRAEALVETEEYDDAIDDLDIILDENPELADALNLRMDINLRTTDFEEAIKDVKKLIDILPPGRQMGYELQLAQLYNAVDEPRRAVRIYNRILPTITTRSQGDEVRRMILRGRGDARLSLGQHKEAVEDYEKALELAPENDGILNNLAWVLATSPKDNLRDGERAIELATKACEVTEYKRPHILSTLASGYAENGDFEKAIEWIEKAMEVNEADRKADESGDETPYDDQLKSLKDELAFYKEKKPWRELQNVEEEKREKELNEKKDSESDEEKSDDKKDSKEDSENDKKTGDDEKSDDKAKDDNDDGGRN